MKIDYVNVSTQEEALKKVKENITEEKLAKFQVSADITDNGVDKLEASGKGFDLYVVFYENYLEVELKLSLMLRPFKSKVESYLEKEVTKVV